MSLSPDLPSSAIETVIAFLLPLILPTLNNQTPAATALALHMLGDYNPQSTRELRLAAEAIGYSLKGLTVLAESAEPGITAEKRDADIKWACSLTRSGHQSERRLAEAQRAAQATLPGQPGQTTATNPAQVTPTNPAQATSTNPADAASNPAQATATKAAQAISTKPAALATLPPQPAAHAPASPEPPAQPLPDETAPGDVPTAEAALAKATKLLNLMQAHHKGAPPPHSSAAQQIQAQQRVVETARLKLEQARRRQQATEAPQPEPAQAAA